jgi:hypothetical protein
MPAVAGELTYAPCGCGCRAPEATEPGCSRPGCCQPGEPVRPVTSRPSVKDPRWKTEPRLLEARMMLLLNRRYLTGAETAELDGLLEWYIHRRS